LSVTAHIALLEYCKKSLSSFDCFCALTLIYESPRRTNFAFGFETTVEPLLLILIRDLLVEFSFISDERILFIAEQGIAGVTPRTLRLLSMLFFYFDVFFVALCIVVSSLHVDCLSTLSAL
jgi:hypothetical protein